MNSERRILIARVVGAFGVRGEVKLQTFTEPASAALKYLPWLMVHNGKEQELSDVRGRVTNKGLTAFLPDVDDRDVAEALTGAEIWIPRSRLPAPKPGEYYWVDLEGLKVVNLEGADLGTVSHVFNTGANDILSVVGERERLIPFIDGQFVHKVDFDAGVITVDWDPDF
jgi:16S rRNA processing protein RimM